MAKKKQTAWSWTGAAHDGTYIRAGWIHNKHDDVPEDKIRLQVHSRHSDIDMAMRPDEATAIIAALGHVMTVQHAREHLKWKAF